MRVAIIGLGVIGYVHAEVLSALRQDVVALCDVNERAAAHVRDTFAPNAKIYADYKAMLDEVKPDAVHVCTPHYLHAEMAVYALQRDIHVLCEKPLAITRGQLDEILQAEERSKAQLGVCHQNRFNDVNVYLKEYLQANEPVVGQGYVAWERDKAYYAQAEWRGTWAQEGGGVLINQALHTLDLMQWFLGYPESVQAKIDTLALKDCIEVEDTASARCFGKVNYAFFATNASFVGNPTQINVRLKNGSQITAFPDVLLMDGKVVSTETITRYFGKQAYGNGHEKLTREFYRCIQSGDKFAIDGKEGAKVVRMILAIYASDGEKIIL